MADLRNLQVTVVVGNPKAHSRTRAVGEAVADAVARRAGDAWSTKLEVVELAELPGLLTWGDPAATAAKETVLASELLIIAAPVYKASFPGLLKAFLDLFGRDELAAVATVPLMVGAAPVHALAVEQQLRPVLIEIGASCPTRGLYVLEKTIESGETGIEAWLDTWGAVLTAVVEARPARSETAT